MYKGYIVRYSDETYYCEASADKRSALIEEATVFPKVENHWMSQAGVKHQDGWNVPIRQIEQAHVLRAELIEVEYEIANVRLLKQA